MCASIFHISKMDAHISSALHLILPRTTERKFCRAQKKLCSQTMHQHYPTNYPHGMCDWIGCYLLVYEIYVYAVCAVPKKFCFQYMENQAYAPQFAMHASCVTVVATFLGKCACLMANTFALFVHSVPNRS